MSGKKAINGSFDEYDSIDGEFSIVAESDDVSSINMSELGSQLSGAANDPPRGMSSAGFGGGGLRRGNSAVNNANEFGQVCDLVIDASDVSAILGVGGNQNEDDTVQQQSMVSEMPLPAETKNIEAERTNNDFIDVDDQKRSNVKLGPLGDELSYANHDDWDLYSDIESEAENEGFLPDWIYSSSNRMKTILVISAAVVVGGLALLIVVSFGASGAGSNVNVIDSSVDRASETVKGMLESGSTPSIAPKDIPTLLPMTTITLSPVFSTTGETLSALRITSNPTNMPININNTAMPTALPISSPTLAQKQPPSKYPTTAALTINPTTQITKSPISGLIWGFFCPI